MSQSRFPFPRYPNGWFQVGVLGGRRARRGRPARATSGATWCSSAPRRAQVNVLDAHCPHMGAHLGYGGKS